ncbi:hypothetical protein QUB05_27780 [Microcoleus sp. F10-C6]
MSQPCSSGRSTVGVAGLLTRRNREAITPLAECDRPPLPHPTDWRWQ